MLKNWKWNKYQIAILAILAMTLIAAYFLPPDARAELRTDVGYVWGGLAMIFGPLVRKKIAAELSKDDGGAR